MSPDPVVVVLLLALCASSPAFATRQHEAHPGIPPAASPGAQTPGAQPAAPQVPNWAGTWRGELVNHPARPGAARVDVERELGPVPMAAGACSPFKTTYREGGAIKAVKDYRLCRGNDPETLFIDEGDGVRLAARLIDGVLVVPFRVDQALLVSQMRLRGDTLEEEILTVADQAPAPGVQSLRPRSIQRLTFVRVPPRQPRLPDQPRQPRRPDYRSVRRNRANRKSLPTPPSCSMN